jgi:hypothetical protein
MMVFIKAAAKYGFKPIKSTGKHLKFVNSAGTRIGAPKTTSDRRSILNFESQARRAAGGATPKPSTAPRTGPAPAPKPTATQPTPTAKQRYEAGEKGLKTGTQTTFKDFMQKVDTARAKTPAPKPAATVPANAGTSTAQRMAQGYDQNIAPVINRRGREVLSSIQRRERLVNKFGSVKEGMLPVPSMARRLMNNPPIQQQQDKEDKFKKQYEKKFKGYDKKIRDLRKELKASNKHRDEKLNYQYKDVTNPKRPSDPVKDLKKKGTA